MPAIHAAAATGGRPCGHGRACRPLQSEAHGRFLDGMPHRATLASLQVLRAVAAMLVLAFHLRIVEAKVAGASILPAAVRFADAGVDLFFVISGVVMALVTRGQFGSPPDAARFFARRFRRVVPLYWLYTTVVVALMAAFPGIANSSYQGQGVLASYLLWPQAQLPLLTVGWTLIHEMYFYVVIAMTLALVSERRLPAVMAAWGALVVVAQFWLAPRHAPWVHLVLNAMTLEFIGGVVLGLYWHRVPEHVARWSLPTGSALLIGAMLVLGHLASTTGHLPVAYPILRTALFGPASVLLVLGALAWERQHPDVLPRALVRLGDSSYSLYLSHVLVVSAVGRIWHMGGATASPWSRVAFLLVAFCAALAFGTASYRLLERRMSGYGVTLRERSAP